MFCVLEFLDLFRVEGGIFDKDPGIVLILDEVFISCVVMKVRV